MKTGINGKFIESEEEKNNSVFIVISHFDEILSEVHQQYGTEEQTALVLITKPVEILDFVSIHKFSQMIKITNKFSISHFFSHVDPCSTQEFLLDTDFTFDANKEKLQQL